MNITAQIKDFFTWKEETEHLSLKAKIEKLHVIDKRLDEGIAKQIADMEDCILSAGEKLRVKDD